MKYEYLRKDLLFSYWIFVWFLLFYFNYVSYNPKIFIIISLIYTCIDWGLQFIYLHPFMNLFWYFLRTLIIKIIPLYLVWNMGVNLLDIVFGLILLLFYLAYIILWYGSIGEFIQVIIKKFQKVINKKNYYSADDEPG